MDPESAAILRRLGGDSSGAQARAFSADLAEQADLVLTMTRAHRRGLLERAPRLLRRTFTLREAAALLDHIPVWEPADVPLEDRARELAWRLDAARAVRPTSDEDDIPDPIGQRPSVHEDVAVMIADGLRPLASLLFDRTSALVGFSRVG
jgi:protein-tyrosine phosphatase